MLSYRSRNTALLLLFAVGWATFKPVVIALILLVPELRKYFFEALNFKAIEYRSFYCWTAIFCVLTAFCYLCLIFGFVEYSNEKIPPLTLYQVIVMVFFAPIIEEFVFRFGLLRYLQKNVAIFTSIALTAVIFGFLHYGFGMMSINGIIGGLFMGILALKTKTIISSTLNHMTLNATIVACIYFITNHRNTFEKINSEYSLHFKIAFVLFVLLLTIASFLTRIHKQAGFFSKTSNT